MAKTTERTALLLGASRGLGLGLAAEYLARGWRVIATAREDASKLEKLARDLLRIERADITDTNAIAALRKALTGEALDLIFVVAGVSGSVPNAIHAISPEDATHVFLTNTYYPLAAAEAFMGLAKPNATVAFMSSRLGSITENERGTWEIYRVSKAGLNMGARSFFHRHNTHPVLSIAPGWVRTEMGGPQATFDVATSCRNVANAIEKHSKTSGHRYVEYDGNELAW